MTDKTYEAWLAFQARSGVGDLAAVDSPYLSTLASKAVRNRVDEMLDAGLSLRVIGERVGTSRTTIARYKRRTAAAQAARAAVPKVLPRDPRSVARRALDHAAAQFDQHRDRVSYDRLTAARAVWESAREVAK